MKFTDEQAKAFHDALWQGDFHTNAGVFKRGHVYLKRITEAGWKIEPPEPSFVVMATIAAPGSRVVDTSRQGGQPNAVVFYKKYFPDHKERAQASADELNSV